MAQENPLVNGDPEECLDWGDDGPADVEAAAVGPSGEPQEGQSVGVAVCTLLAAIPALIGSWCWPILVGAMFAVAANQVPGGLVDFFHGLQVAIMLALMTNITQFAWWKVKGKKGLSHWAKYGPCYLLLIATVLVNIQPTCMLVISSWKFHNFFFDGDDNTNALTPNTTIGWLIQVFGTYLGFFIMFVAVFWATNLHTKIVKKWYEARGMRYPR